jgi:glycosyltransferase involved in cell wall biosynthesis
MSVLHVLAPGLAGGLESVVASLVSGQKARGHRVGVVSVTGRGQPEPGLHASLRSRGVETLPVELPARAYSRERSEYRTIFRRIRPDIVHTHGYRTDVLAGGIAGALGIPRVTTVHGFTGGDWKNRIYEALQLRAFKRFEAVVAVSRPLAAKLERRGVPRRSLTIISNAFDPSVVPLSRGEARRVLGLSPEATVIGWVGRLSREKGLDVMLDALGRLGSQGLELSVVGDGGERHGLTRRVTRLSLESRVHWHGLVPDAGRLYRAFDVFVLSSRTEGTPISLFEAMAAGTPIVAAAVGGVPDVIRQSEGWLVPPENPRLLAETIAAALGDPREAASRARRARHRLEEVYGLDAWLDAYDRLYRSIILPKAD